MSVYGSMLCPGCGVTYPEPECRHCGPSYAALPPLPPFADPTVQSVYSVLCSDDVAPDGEHWEGYTARRIVAAAAPRLAAAEQMAQSLRVLQQAGVHLTMPFSWVESGADAARAAWEAAK